jgi:hypothetical protein
MFGLAFASVVIISWMMLPWADKRAGEGSLADAWLWRMSWFMALGFVLANSIIYTVHYRTEMTETKGLRIDAYERAQRLEALAAAELTGLRTNPRWEATSSCSNATAAKSIQYCEQVRDAQARIQAAGTILEKGRPASKDSGAETLGWVLGVDEAKIRRSLPIFWAVILELIASLCMREAFATVRAPRDERSGTAEDAASNSKAAAPSQPAGTVIAEVPHLSVLASFNREAVTLPRHGAMNDNMPLAAYA